MKRIVYFLLLLPLGVVLIVLSVANRQPVTLRLDPFNDVDPALSVSLPFFGFLFAALLVGMIVGAVATWFGQGRHRKAAKRERAEARRWQGEAEAARSRADELAANLTVSQSSAASGQMAGASLPAPSGSGEKAA